MQYHHKGMLYNENIFYFYKKQFQGIALPASSSLLSRSHPRRGLTRTLSRPSGGGPPSPPSLLYPSASSRSDKIASIASSSSSWDLIAMLASGRHTPVTNTYPRTIIAHVSISPLFISDSVHAHRQPPIVHTSSRQVAALPHAKASCRACIAPHALAQPPFAGFVA
ncbi:hypothetical protein O988_06852 [Pseudogymnoascus sp. VKM F-3808]|nr:hypothetical protein O988_06852 [Pseudogymnoascus sp. VKM F-3808]